MTRPNYRVAVIGCGPKGLFALERLDALCARAGCGLDIDLFDPHPHLGAGPVYDPEQPHFLRMNFAARHIDLWHRGDEESDRQSPVGTSVVGSSLAGRRPAGERPAGPSLAGPTLVEWLFIQHGEWADPDAYVPRALVGEYLNEGAQEIVRRLARFGRVTLHPCEVTGLRRDGGRWRVESAQEPAVWVDEVLVTTGHGSRDGAASQPVSPDARVYPVTTELSVERIRPGSSVLMRGIGLTAFDAIAAFRSREPALRPDRIVPFSRTGRMMLPKRAPGVVPGDRAEDAWRHGRRKLKAAGSVGEVIGVLAGVATESCGLPNRTGHDQTATVLNDLLTRSRGGIDEHDPSAQLESGIATAHGHQAWDAPRALGEAWRALYPAVVEWHAGARPHGRDQRRFARLCAELERLAFGPPVHIAEALLHDIEEGWVVPTVSAAPAVVPTDYFVDAVLAGPGVLPGPSPLFQSLIDGGHIRTVPGWGAVEIRSDARAVSAAGTPSPGLSVIGRATEGCVLGNDTLDRTLHAHSWEWAAAVVRRARECGRLAS